jgi:hypothetical protein
MKKLSILLMFIALVACIACQRQQTEERKNSETQREMQKRLSAEHQAQEQQEVTPREAKLNPNEKAPEMTSTPASSESPEKRNAFKSQAQKFQPRRIVPMTSPTKETPTSLEAPGENKTEKQENDRKEAVEGGEGPSRLPTPTEETSPLQAKIPQGILEPILDKAAELAKVGREQLVMVRAEPVVWNDGSLGCPEPGMMYTQALVNGYWVIIDAAGQTYDFRVDRSGRFQLCPQGQGQPPSQPAAE